MAAVTYKLYTNRWYRDSRTNHWAFFVPLWKSPWTPT